MRFLILKHKSGQRIVDQYCYFHPSSIAKWQCSQCARFFDNACIANTNENPPSAKCPNCQSRLKYLPVEKENRTVFSLSLFNVIRDCLNPLYAYLLLSAIVTGLIVSMSKLASPYQFALSCALVIFSCLHYARCFAYELHNLHPNLHRTRQKKIRKKSQLAQLSLQTSLQLSVLSLCLLLFPVFCFYYLNWFIGILLIIMSSISFPFVLIFSLHTNDDGLKLSSLFRQLKPWVPTLTSTGLISITTILASYELSGYVLPSFISLPLFSCLLMLALCLLINLSCKAFFYGIQQGHTVNESLLEPKGQPSIYNKEKISNLNIDLDQALKTGNYPKVVSLLEDSLKRNSHSMLRREQLFLVLMEMKDFEKLQRFSVLFLYWMIERNKVKDASRFIYLLRKQDPSFQLQDIELVALLAKHFLSTKRFALVLWLAEGSIKRFRPSESLCVLLISAAQAHITHYKDLTKAEEILLLIFNQYSQFPSAATAKALLLHIQNHIKNQKELKS